jgi:hypothetical protein
MRKELSPLPSRSHVIYYSSAEGFIFLDRVGSVEDAVVGFSETCGKKTIIYSFIAIHAIDQIGDTFP